MFSDGASEGILLAIGGLVAFVGIVASAQGAGFWPLPAMSAAGGFLAGTIYGIRKVRAEGAQALLEEARA